ncbi:hypothetical protein [Nonomuraea insulae]|uniref:Sel1 repeat family protein n=1 Tax=Nonomuraea insulae TaxID=1616787 RepID=A0ABW1CLH3_9ACTN
MTDIPRAGAHFAFIAALIELRESAGQPSYSEMHRLSRTPDIPKELPPSTLNDILNGKRERLPDWKLVASFVMVCHRHAEQTGLPTYALGTVEQWQTHWRIARNRPHATGSYDLFTTPADEAERRTTRTAALLVRRSAEGDVEAAYRLAIINVLTDEPAAAHYWIHIAVEHRHPGAQALALHPHQLEFAANVSFSYGRAYEQEGPAKRDLARFYYRLAAERGHPRAAERLRVLRAVPFGKLLPAPVATEDPARS